MPPAGSVDELNRVALITGASRGIGAATALQFAAAGYRVGIVALEQREAEAVARTITESGGQALVIAGDLADLEFAKRAVDRTCAEFARIDVLVNNAAWRELTSMRHISLESWERSLRVCLTAPAFLARWAAESMMLRSSGVIINVSSMMSRQAAGISPAYIASKGGLDALTFELASLYGPMGIRVVSVQPGAVDTGLGTDVGQAAEHRDEIREFSEDMIMLGRWATAVEIARVILFLAGSDASYITGTTITVDGGWHHQHFPQSLKRSAFGADGPRPSKPSEA